jgi:acetyl-CoA acetyltransferase
LTLDAALAAVEDAGLTRDHIDGLAAYPGGGGAAPGFAGPSLLEVHDSLRLELSWYTSGVDVPAQLSPVMQAAMAVGSGMARHVLVYRTVTEGSARSRARAATEGAGSPAGGSSPGPAPRVEGPMQWLAAYGITGAPQWYAFYVRRYMHDFGLTREQLAQVPLSARTKAALNPKAVYREPVSLDDYLTSRMIADPLCLYDCDVPCDGATAFVVSRAGRIDAPSGHLVEIQSAGAGAGPRMYRDQFADVWWAGPAADQLWSRTELEQSDVDTAQLYDGFSFLALAWLESSASAAAARRATSSTAAAASRWTASSRSTPAGASSPPAGCTGWGTFTRRACSYGRRPVRGRCPTPRWRSSPPADSRTWVASS